MDLIFANYYLTVVSRLSIFAQVRVNQEMEARSDESATGIWFSDYSAHFRGILDFGL